MGNIIGLDLGTSTVKALLIDEAQQVIGSASAPLDVLRPRPGWSEQCPQGWLDAVAQAIDALKQTHAHALAAVTGIGLSGQMHGATLLDAADQPLRHAILWNDTRSHAQAAAMDSNPLFREQSGNMVFPGFTAPKLAWCQVNEPDIFRAVRTVLLPKDYVRLWLTGEKITDQSDASGTSWLNVEQRDWSDDLLGECNLSRDAMPLLVDGTAPAGQLRALLASRWGIEQPVCVAGGAGDNAAAACGLGVTRDESAFVSLGTSGVLFAANAAYRPDAQSAVHTFCHALPNTWHQMGVTLSATDSLNWFAGLVGCNAASLTAELGDNVVAPDGALFLPYFSGERTPHNESRAMGTFTGMSHQHDRVALTRALIAGVSFAIRDSLASLRATGTSFQRVLAVGGGSQSGVWLRTLATVLGLPVDQPAAGELGAAFGAARLGLIASGAGSAGTVCTSPKSVVSFDPDEAMSDAFDRSYDQYRRLYPALSAVIR